MGEENKSFEKNIQELQDIVQKLEQGELSLEEGVELFKKGLSLSKSCKEQLEKAKYEVQVLSEELNSEEHEEGDD